MFAQSDASNRIVNVTLFYMFSTFDVDLMATLSSTTSLGFMQVLHER